MLRHGLSFFPKQNELVAPTATGPGPRRMAGGRASACAATRHGGRADLVARAGGFAPAPIVGWFAGVAGVPSPLSCAHFTAARIAGNSDGLHLRRPAPTARTH